MPYVRRKKTCPRCFGEMSAGARDNCMECKRGMAGKLAAEYGVSRRKIMRLGIKQLLAMKPEARRLLLNPSPLQLSPCELHKGGLARRGFNMKPAPASRSSFDEVRSGSQRQPPTL